MNRQASWYKLIHYWCSSRSPKGYGLTIPFLIGATDFSNIGDLLMEISNTEVPQKIILRFCWDREEYVLSLDDPIYPLSNHLTGQYNLLYDDEQIESFETFEGVISYLNDRYLDKIENGLFSKNMKTNEWEAFSSSDEDFISEVLAE